MSTPALISSVELLKEFIAFPSISRTPNMDLIMRIKELLSHAGISASIVTDPQDSSRGNLFASVGPSDKQGILLSGHTDVVPVQGQSWHSDPFTATTRDGRIYGRGSSDMKGFVACAVAAMLQAANQPLQRPLQIALSFDEEIGCVGVRHLLNQLESQKITPPLFCIVGEPTLMQIGTGHKGKSAYRALCCGQAGHSGLAPRFHNAIHTAADLINAMRETQQDLANHGARQEGYDIPYSTIHAGTIAGGSALNIVPQACEVQFEIRTVSDDKPEQILEQILKRTQAHMEMSTTANKPPMPTIELVNAYPGLRTPEDSLPVKLLTSLLPDGTKCTKVAFGTEGGLFQNTWQNTPVVVCGPGSIEVAHKADEYIEIAQLHTCDELLMQLRHFLCQPK